MINKRTVVFFFSFAAMLIIVLLTTSCKKNTFDTDNSAKLKFSADTLLFDTVFTTLGFTTMQLKVHNTYNKKIKISSIRLANASKSHFIMNVDGVATSEADNVELAAGDSIYIFVKVTIDPNNSNSPFVVSDSILFLTNGNFKGLAVAWGQNAYYHTPNRPKSNPWYYLDLLNTTWVNDKPHILYGYFVVDLSVTLTIKEGTKIYA